MESGSWLKDSRVIVVAGACAVAGFLIAALIFGAPWHLPPDWGDIPTWLATLAASLAAAMAYRVYQVEAQRDRISEQERRSAQAAKVVAWYGFMERNVTRKMGRISPDNYGSRAHMGGVSEKCIRSPSFRCHCEISFASSRQR